MNMKGKRGCDIFVSFYSQNESGRGGVAFRRAGFARARAALYAIPSCRLPVNGSAA
jgi:hypothetical protein